MAKQLGLDELSYLEKTYGERGTFFKKKKGRTCGLIRVSGVPPGKKKRVKIATHNGCIGSQFDHNIREKYRKKGYKKFISKPI